jgi:4-hydroxy-2-oxoglutarate aldolase
MPIMLKGSFPPIPTPFEEGRFAPERLAENLDLWAADPLDGYVVLGSNGEAPLLEDHERQAVVRTVYEHIAPGRRMIVGAGRESTAATIRSVREVFELGADAVLVGVPSYYKPAMTDAALREHYLRVADESPGPMLLYSVPVFTGIPIGVSLFAELIRHERIAGIKDSSGDPAAIVAMVAATRAAGREASVMVGSARALARGILAGASGSVLAVSSIAAAAVDGIAKAAAAGAADEAIRLNDALLPLAEAVTSRHGIGGLKAGLELRSFYGGDPRPPLRPIDAAARQEIAALMKGLGIATASCAR